MTAIAIAAPDAGSADITIDRDEVLQIRPGRADTRSCMAVPLPPPSPLDHGVAGAAHAPSVDRRRKPHVDRTSPLGRTSARERRLGARLDREVGPIGAVLHGRETADCVVDHLVVASTGVWLVGAEHSVGRIGWFDRRRGTLPAGSRAPSEFHPDAESLIARLLEPIGFDWVDVHRALCFTNTDWGPMAKPFLVDGVLVTSGQALVERIASLGPINPADVQTIAAELGTRMPSAFSAPAD
jgi:hypothetical protein